MNRGRAAVLALLLARVAPAVDLPSLESLRADSRSRVGIGGFTAYLYAADEVRSAESLGSCFAAKDGAEFRGTYRLMVANAREVVSSIDLASNMFAEGRWHDGLRVMAFPGRSERLLGIYQYASCSTSELRLFRIDRRGVVAPIEVIDLDGAARDLTLVGHDGVLRDARGRAVLCDWHMGWLLTFCSAYRFDGRSLRATDAWASEGRTRPEFLAPTARDRARFVLTHFLGFLFDERLDRASAYCAGSRNDIRRFCDSCRERRCPWPDTIRDLPARGAGRFRFAVSQRERSEDDDLDLEVVERGGRLVVGPLPSCSVAR